MFKKFCFKEDGSTVVLVALCMTALLSFCALTMDIGRVYLEKSKLQSAVDASTLAAAQQLPNKTKAINNANKYILLNGYEPADISIEFLDSNNKVKVTASKTIEYSFAKILGFKESTILESATGEKERLGGPFNYALFSGDTNSTLSINVSSLNINGSTHSNKNFSLNCSTAVITGACEAVSGISINGSNINIKNRITPSSVIEMPDFSDTIKDLAQASGQYYNHDKSFNTSSLNIDEAMFVNGNINFNLSNFEGVGTVCATNDIRFNASSIRLGTDDAICFYTTNGGIYINGSTVNVDGILYAPNGSINISASTVNVNGRIIGDKIAINASNINIITGTKELSCLPSASTKLVE